MRLQRGVKSFLLGCAVAWLSVVSAMASPYHGQVTFNGLPLPGSVVTVTATQGDKKAVAVSDDQGLFGFADLADGNWSLDIEMTGFAPLQSTQTPKQPWLAFAWEVVPILVVLQKYGAATQEPLLLVNLAMPLVWSAP